MNIGILSTADIATRRLLPGAEGSDVTVLAIASRTPDRAEAVAEEFDVPRAYGSYEALLEDSDLDAVYNPLPNALHAEWTERAADAGLHVLCEKPLASDAGEAREMVDHCADRGVVLMEGFMYRYHPRTERAIEIAREELGAIRAMNADFHFRLEGGYDIRVDPDLAGGSLMDAGCYPVDVVRAIVGDPERVYATSIDRREVGVDTQLTGLAEFESATATLSTGFDAQLQRYSVQAADGSLEVERSFVATDETRLVYTLDGERYEERFEPADHFRHELDHFADCVASGTTPRTSGEEAVRNMRFIDALYGSAERGRPVALD